MSTEAAIRPNEVDAPQASVMHKARDREQHARATSGLSWTTRCGVLSKPTGRPRKSATLKPMEKCVICVSLPLPEETTA